MLIVRGSHSQLIDGETVVVSQFTVVDVISGQLVGTVGPPCYGVAPATAEFLNNSDDVLLVTYSVLLQSVTGRPTAADGTGCSSESNPLSYFANFKQPLKIL